MSIPTEQQKLEQLTKLLDGLSHTQNAEMHMGICEKAPWIPQTEFSEYLIPSNKYEFYKEAAYILFPSVPLF